jgi:hypothetical protein
VPAAAKLSPPPLPSPVVDDPPLLSPGEPERGSEFTPAFGSITRRRRSTILPLIGAVAVLGVVAGLVILIARPAALFSKTDGSAPIKDNRDLAAGLKKLLRLERVSVTADPFQFAGHTSFSFETTLRIIRLPDAPAQLADDDLWVWAIYVSGNPSVAEMTNFMANLKLKWKGKPSSTFERSTDNKKYRFEQVPLTVTPVSSEKKPGDKEILCYSMVVAPHNPSDRWALGKSQVISFPILGYVLADLVRVEEQSRYESRGVAAVCLCSFQSDQFVPICQPIVLDMEAGEARPEKQPNPQPNK